MRAQKQELLDHYATREPREFYQFDGFNHPTGVLGYRDEGKDGTEDDGGDDLFCSRTYELMYGATVRILIAAGTSKEDAVRLLKKLTAWVEKGGFEVVTELAPVMGK